MDATATGAARVLKEKEQLSDLPVWHSGHTFSMQVNDEVFTVSLPVDYPVSAPTWSLTGRRSEEVETIMSSWKPSSSLRSLFEQLVVLERRSGVHLELRWCLLLGVTLRVLAAFHAASGESTPPKFGDFEAQRHWMELTTNVPRHEWYDKNATSQHSAPNHWPLDYPPLTAWHSYICGLIIGFFEPEAMELFTSRGYETLSSKHLLRMSVLVSEILFLAAAYTFARRRGSRPELLLLFMLAPPYLILDHAHFQFNCVPLGLTMWAILCAQRRRRVVASVFFCMALLFKQTFLYFAPAFFAYLFGDCVFALHADGNEREYRRRPVANIITRLIPLAVATIATFAVGLLPFASTIGDVVRSIFPFSRGIFEDYVANVWVALSPVLRLRNMDPSKIPLLVKLTTAVTLCAMMPSMVDVFRRPCFTKFLFALWSSSMAFYLFSWQVHEKAIMLPLMPVLLLYPCVGNFSLMFVTVASYSLLPLAGKDHNIVLLISTTGTFLMFVYSIFTWWHPSGGSAGRIQETLMKCLRYFGVQLSFESVSFLGTVGAIAVLLPLHMIPRPERLPFLAEWVNSAFCCAFFVLSMVWALIQQYRIKFDLDVVDISEEKKDD